MKIISLLVMLCIIDLITPQKVAAQSASVNFQVFYNELSPYGTWVNNPEYGYVWIPDVASGFSPYATNGHWILTDDGWTWISNYSWGWAPFHYGRWYTDDTYGPTWVPDYDWGPGWVNWRTSSDYYGWSPMRPGISIGISFGGDYYTHNRDWTFVAGRNFGRSNINNYYINSSNNVNIYRNTTIINNRQLDRSHNVSYNAGPDRREVEKRVGRTFSPVTIKERSNPGQSLSKNQLQIYRPQMQKGNTAGQKPAPSRVANLKDVKTSAQRSEGGGSQKINQQIRQQSGQQQKGNQPSKPQQQNQQQAKQQQQNQQQARQQQQNQQQAKQQQQNQQQARQQQQNQQQAKQQQQNQQQARQQQQNQQQAKQQQQNQQQQNQQQARQQQQNQQQAKQQQQNQQQARQQQQQQQRQQPQQQQQQRQQPQQQQQQQRQQPQQQQQQRQQPQQQQQQRKDNKPPEQ